jgi:hypothetical protein
MTLSRNTTASRMAAPRRFQSSPLPAANFPRLIEPSTHDSYGSSGCSPHGFVVSITPSDGVGLWRLISSTNSSPGSPVAHAAPTMPLNNAAGSTVRATRPLRGLRSGNGVPASSAAKNSSLTPTERLKFSSCPGARLALMNSSMSGWSTRSTAMLAPRRRPPARITAVVWSNRCMNDSGPELMPPVDCTRSWRGRSALKENPVPPPVW